MKKRKTAAVILAAGKGTRMKSALPKVLHPIAGRPMIRHLLAEVAALRPDRTVVVIGPGMDEVGAAIAPIPTVVQKERLGTGHAVLAARRALSGLDGDLLVLCGDTPLITARTLRSMLAARRRRPHPAVVVLGMEPDEPGAYGRLVLGADGRLERIVEARDAGPAERRIGLCNAGALVADAATLFRLLRGVGRDNAKGEYYLTDVVAIANRRGLRCAVARGDAGEMIGVNSRADLARVEAVVQTRLRAAAMAAGVTMADPGTVHLSHDTRFGRDVTVGPYVVFGPGVSVGDGAEVRPFSHLEGARIAAGAAVGPFARLRPGADIGPGARVGNFVEVKEARLEAGAKANHLAYIGDSRIGAGANIGAGTITCNYDGFHKARTEIGPGAFIGSNTALVAPVSVGARAIVGAGSVITRDVEDDSMSVARGEQRNLPGRAVRYRAARGGKTASAAAGSREGGRGRPHRRKTRGTGKA